MATLESILSESALFSGLDATSRGALSQCLKPRKLEAGEVLFRQGDAGDFLGVVLKGSFSVACADPRGAEVEVARLGVGEVFGEMACLDPAPRSHRRARVALTPRLRSRSASRPR